MEDNVTPRNCLTPIMNEYQLEWHALQSTGCSENLTLGNIIGQTNKRVDKARRLVYESGKNAETRKVAVAVYDRKLKLSA